MEYADVFTSSAEYAGRFSGSSGNYMLLVQERAIASMLFPYKAMSVLDVGGGHGQLIGLYKRLGMNIMLHGSSPVCFERLGDLQSENIRRVVSSPSEIPLKDKSIDVVVSVRLLSHMDHWDDFLGELCRVARKAVIVDYPSTRSLNIFTPLLFDMKKNIEKNTRSYLSFSSRELRLSFQKYGYKKFSEQALFFLPMVVHRIGGGNTILRNAEAVFKLSRLTSFLGSPIILKAEKL